MSMSDERILRKYIRESLVLELGLRDVGTMLGFGKGSKYKGGPEKWFIDFLQSQLDLAGEKIDDFLGKKLDQILPDDIKQRISKYEKQSGNTSSEVLAKVVVGWIKDAEELLDEDIPSSTEKQISDFAAQAYAEALKKDPDVKKALVWVKRKLDMQYGQYLSKDSKKKIK